MKLNHFCPLILTNMTRRIINIFVPLQCKQRKNILLHQNKCVCFPEVFIGGKMRKIIYSIFFYNFLIMKKNISSAKFTLVVCLSICLLKLEEKKEMIIIGNFECFSKLKSYLISKIEFLAKC